MDWVGAKEINRLLHASPKKGELLVKELAKRYEVLDPYLHEVSLRLLKKDTERWEELFNNYLDGKDKELDRFEMKCILFRIEEARKAFSSYSGIDSQIRILAQEKSNENG